MTDIEDLKMACIRIRLAGVSLVTSVMIVMAGVGLSCAAPAPPSNPVVIELFTSQGCSSCPPADALLGELASKPHVIALGFHVDYWNGIGWHDPYSQPEATERQHAYVNALRLSTAFTPEIVIDGRRSFVGSDRAGVTGALSEPPATLLVTAAVVRDQLVIALPDAEKTGHYDVTAIAYLPQTTTRIGGGENGGRTLTEYNVVRQIRRLEVWDGTARTISVPLPLFPSDARQVAILVQQVHQGPIVGAVSISLDNASGPK